MNLSPLFMRKDTANFLDRFARAEIVSADVKPHHRGPAEGVLKHEVFQLAVRPATPVASAEKGIANGNFFAGRIPVVES